MRRPTPPLPRFLLVVGCQRSGTTLLGQMLGAHPAAILIDEDEGAYQVVSAIVNGETVGPVLDRLLPKARQKYADRRKVEAATPSHIILKAPNATFLADSLRKSPFPLSFVFAARDVREVVHSMWRLQQVPMIDNQRRRMAAEPSIAARFAVEIATLDDPDIAEHVKFATIWRVKTGLYREFCAHPLSALLVRYNELVRDPDGWSARLQAHAGLPDTGANIAHYKVMRGTAIGLTDRGRAVDSASQAKWKGALSESQLRDIHAVAGELMDELSLT